MEAITIFARKTAAEVGLPPVLAMASFKALRLDLLIERIGLSFESRIGLGAASQSESGGVRGDGHAPGVD